MYDDFWVDFSFEIKFTMEAYNGFFKDINRRNWKHNVVYDYRNIECPNDKNNPIVNYNAYQDIICDGKVVPYGMNRDKSGKEPGWFDAFQPVLTYITTYKDYIDDFNSMVPSNIITAIYIPEGIPMTIKIGELIVYDAKVVNEVKITPLINLDYESCENIASKFTESDVEDIRMENILAMNGKIKEQEIHKYGIPYFYKNDKKYIRHVPIKPYFPNINMDCYAESPFDCDCYVEYLNDDYDHYFKYENMIYWNDNYIFQVKLSSRTRPKNLCAVPNKVLCTPVGKDELLEIIGNGISRGE